MKYIIVILSLVFLTGISSLSVYAGTISVSGTLSKETTSTTNTAAIEVRDCDNNLLSTIASTAITSTKYEPYLKNNQILRFIVTRLENPEVAIITIDTNINTTNYNAANGEFSVDLVRNLISESRYNYKVQVKISEGNYGSVLLEREYSIAPAGSGSAFPIGSVIAYLGNNGNIAGMEANGWFKCDGRSISGLSAALSADEITAFTNVVGNNLPDLRGMFLRGVDQGRGYDDDAGSRTGGESTTGVRSYQGCKVEDITSTGTAASAGNHGHTGTAASAGGHDHGGSTGVGGYGRDNEGKGSGSGDAASDSGNHTHSISTDGAHTHSITIDAAVAHTHSITIDDAVAHTHSVSVSYDAGGGNETRPENTAVYYLIRGR